MSDPTAERSPALLELPGRVDADSKTAPVRSRGLLSWSATTLPITPVLLMGVLLGPQGLALLTGRALSAIDPAIPVALTALGALVSLERGAPEDPSARLDAAGVALAVVTMLVVGCGLAGAFLLTATGITSGWLMPVVCGLCAAGSVTVAGRASDERRGEKGAITASEVTFTTIIGAALLVTVSATGSVGLRMLQSSGIAVVLAAAGWLLVRQTTSTTERRVFAMATLLLVGGSADLLGTSPLLAGVIAGVLWRQLGDPSCETLRRETHYVQHPFIVLVLLAAGANTEWTVFTFGTGAAYASLRAVTRAAAGTAVRRFATGVSPDLRMQLAAPGVFGVALALTVVRVAGNMPAASTALSVVVIGTILSDIVARVSESREVVA